MRTLVIAKPNSNDGQFAVLLGGLSKADIGLALEELMVKALKRGNPRKSKNRPSGEKDSK